MSDIVIGIDPGITGAIAVNYNHRIEAVYDMPIMPKRSGKGNQIDPKALTEIIDTIVNIEYDFLECEANVETVSAMPGQGVTSVFSFGKSAGIIEGVLAALDVPINMITPQRWKKAEGLTGKDKDAARLKAIKDHPEIADRLTRKKDNGRADAIMISRQ